MEEKDDEIRKEFAKAFGWFEKLGQYDNYANTNTKPRTPTWSEIFVELGKVLAARDFRDIEGNLAEIDQRLINLEKDINP